MLLNKNPKVTGYRPHHGLHLGVWRTPQDSIDPNSFLNSELYKDYYLQFNNLRANDEVLNEIIDLSSGYIKSIINNMEIFYKNLK